MKQIVIKAFVVLIWITSFTDNALSQTTYDENLPITNIPTGILYQTGPGDVNSKNWTYPYSTKLTINGGLSRNFEISTLGKDNEAFLVRQFSQTTNGWTNWRQLLLTDGNGNVGIGTTNPAAKLHVAHTNRMSITLGGPSTSSGAVADLYFKTKDNQEVGGTTYWNWSFRTDSWSSAPGDFVLYSNNGTYTSPIIAQADGDLLLTTGNGSARNGNVGIGTTTPDYKLDVLGTIRANEIKVATGWSDFVFEPDYDLPSLQEVETYINQNGHLPDIPSAEEVKADGISLGEIDAKLLQKIEELTLYVIELKKSDQSHLALMQKLIQENNDLRERVIQIENED